ncbi:MAG: hypothetical protein GQ565_09830 [Candidatus Aegiribacteria sp.]|nr:hypothetical protein [Candidatus Aegiribacteria sp.]
MQVRILVLAVTVICQFLMELTVGRMFFAPSLVPLILVYLSENYEKMWAVGGAFWSGLCLDFLLHQPPGSSSLALLAGLYAAKAFSKLSSGEGKGYLLSMTAIAVIVSDTLFILVASRPLGSGFNSVLLLVIPRAILTVIIGVLFLTVIEWISDMRSRKVIG